MKRYEHWCSLDVGGMGEPEETTGGDWVRYEDALAAVAAERERCTRKAADIASACATMYRTEAEAAVCRHIAHELGRAPL